MHAPISLQSSSQASPSPGGQDQELTGNSEFLDMACSSSSELEGESQICLIKDKEERSSRSNPDWSIVDEFEADWTQEQATESGIASDPVTPLRRAPVAIPMSSEKFAEAVATSEVHSVVEASKVLQDDSDDQQPFEGTLISDETQTKTALSFSHEDTACELPAEGNQYPELRCQTHLEFSMSLDDDSPLACDEQCEEQTLDSRAIEVQGQEDDKMAADDCLEPRKNTLAVEDLAQADVAMQRQLEEWACEEIGADGTFSEEASTLEDKSLAVLSKQEQPVELVEAEMPAPSVSPSAGFDVIDAEDSSPHCPKAAAAIDSKTAAGKFMDQSPEPTVGQELHPVVCCEAEVGTGMGSSLSSFGQVAVAAEPAHALPAGMHLPKVDVLPDSEQGQKPAPEVNEGQKLRHSASTPCLKTVQSKKVACRPKPEAKQKLSPTSAAKSDVAKSQTKSPKIAAAEGTGKAMATPPADHLEVTEANPDVRAFWKALDKKAVESEKASRIPRPRIHSAATSRESTAPLAQQATRNVAAVEPRPATASKRQADTMSKIPRPRLPSVSTAKAAAKSGRVERPQQPDRPQPEAASAGKKRAVPKASTNSALSTKNPRARILPGPKPRGKASISQQEVAPSAARPASQPTIIVATGESFTGTTPENAAEESRASTWGLEPVLENEEMKCSSQPECIVTPEAGSASLPKRLTCPGKPFDREGLVADDPIVDDSVAGARSPTGHCAHLGLEVPPQPGQSAQVIASSARQAGQDYSQGLSEHAEQSRPSYTTATVSEHAPDQARASMQSSETQDKGQSGHSNADSALQTEAATGPSARNPASPASPAFKADDVLVGGNQTPALCCEMAESETVCEILANSRRSDPVSPTHSAHRELPESPEDVQEDLVDADAGESADAAAWGSADASLSAGTPSEGLKDKEYESDKIADEQQLLDIEHSAKKASPDLDASQSEDAVDPEVAGHEAASSEVSDPVPFHPTDGVIEEGTDAPTDLPEVHAEDASIYAELHDDAHWALAGVPLCAGVGADSLEPGSFENALADELFVSQEEVLVGSETPALCCEMLANSGRSDPVSPTHSAHQELPESSEEVQEDLVEADAGESADAAAWGSADASSSAGTPSEGLKDEEYESDKIADEQQLLDTEHSAKQASPDLDASQSEDAVDPEAAGNEAASSEVIYPVPFHPTDGVIEEGTDAPADLPEVHAEDASIYAEPHDDAHWALADVPLCAGVGADSLEPGSFENALADELFVSQEEVLDGSETPALCCVIAESDTIGEKILANSGSSDALSPTHSTGENANAAAAGLADASLATGIANEISEGSEPGKARKDAKSWDDVMLAMQANFWSLDIFVEEFHDGQSQTQATSQDHDSVLDRSNESEATPGPPQALSCSVGAAEMHRSREGDELPKKKYQERSRRKVAFVFLLSVTLILPELAWRLGPLPDAFA